MSNDLHAETEMRRAGASLKTATGAIILLHGRGASASDILSLGEVLGGPDLAYLAPQAAGHTWYPYSFLAPREENEPSLSSALRRVESILEEIIAAGIPTDRVILCGFSQGACLATEFVASHPARYAGLIAYTGGMIGPLNEPLRAGGDLAGTPVLLSSGDPDPHVPWVRVLESADVLTKMGGVVTTKRHPGRPHTVLKEEIELGRELVMAAFPQAGGPK